MWGGDNEGGLQQILDMLRMVSLVILLLHFYFYGYEIFRALGITTVITDKLLFNLARTGLFDTFHTCKFWSLALLGISLIGGKGKKMEKLQYAIPVICLGAGLLLYFGAGLIIYLSLSEASAMVLYAVTCLLGYILVLTGGNLLSRILRTRLSKDVFNTVNESFPQEQRRLDNEYSINLPTSYFVRGKKKEGCINIINPFRGLLVMGSPGSGKSWYVIREIIRQHIEKGYTMFIYDFKYDDLTKLAFNYYLRYPSTKPVKTSFYSIDFDDLPHSHRCNPLHKSTLHAIADAAESARTILLGLNRDWIEKQGDFWVESSISFMTALIWYLRKYEDGKYCSFPHVMELLQVDYGELFSVLRAEPEIRNYVNPFVSAYINNVTETLDNQVSSLKIAISRLNSPAVYYIMSGDDLSLDINNPAAPKILCIGNSPQRSGIYGAIISLYITSINRLVNRKGMLKSSHIYDELPTVRVHALNELVATGRSNKVAVTMCVQDVSQLRLNYGRNQAEVIANLPGNIISSQVSGDSARHLSERIGRIIQERDTIQINRNDTSFSRAEHLDMAIPPSRIAGLSAGEFVGVVADDPEQPIQWKAFHGTIVQDNDRIRREQSAFRDLPLVRKLGPEEVMDNYSRIRDEVTELVESELDRMKNTPGLAELIVVKIGE